ncbi:MAG: TonB-dependent receptor [Bacteroidota bacterium]
MTRQRVLLAVFQFLLISHLVAGTTGKVSGTLIDASTKEPVVGANVMLLNTVLGASSDVNGYFCILNVPPGTYDVRVSCIGYRTVIKKQISVSSDRTTTEDFSLAATTVDLEAVEIVAQRETIVKDLTSTMEKVSAEDIKNLPVENVNDILQLQAGMTKDAGGNLHMRGGRSSETQYYVDGMSTSNPFGGGDNAVNVQNNNIQELQVISGTFNAEYGQAMSSIVNIVTKDGGERTNMSVTAYGGDFVTARNEVFPNLGGFRPTTQQYVEGTISGPASFLSDDLRFFVSGRYRNEQNWLYGIRHYLPVDTADYSSTDPSQWTVQHTGDDAVVPMNPSLERSLQAKLSYRPLGSLYISYNIISDNGQAKGYDHAHKLSPEYVPTVYTQGLNNLLTFTHTLSSSAFQELKVSYFVYRLQSHVRDNPFDPIYNQGLHYTQTSLTDVFAVGGVNPRFLDRKSTTLAVKYELTNQFDRNNLVKLGAELRSYELREEMFDVRKDAGTNWQLQIDNLTSAVHNLYDKRPTEFAAYVQDKIEVEDLIVNAGVRFDYFDPKSMLPANMDDPQNKRSVDPSQAFVQASKKTQISPRLGLAFPISESGNIHASYGHFFQIPEFQRLYENPEFEVSGRFTTFLGNADLEAQRTVIYEVGLQQLVSSNLVLDATCYFKDFRHLAGSKLYRTFEQDEYGQYTNVDYGNVWGVTLALDVLRTGMLTANLDYTYQVAEGNGSDPYQAYYDARNRDESTKSLVPLNWDVRHSLNGVLYLDNESWGLSVISRFASGIPFTPTTTFERTRNVQLMNQGRRRSEYTMDFRVYKNLPFLGPGTMVFLSVENVFDGQRIDYVPELTEQDLRTHESRAQFNSLYDYRFNPNTQPRPRLVKMGLRVSI